MRKTTSCLVQGRESGAESPHSEASTGEEPMLRLWLVEDCATLHDERDLGEDADVVEGIAGDGDDIGEIVGLESTDFVLPAEKLRAIQ